MTTVKTMYTSLLNLHRIYAAFKLKSLDELKRDGI